MGLFDRSRDAEGAPVVDSAALLRIGRLLSGRSQSDLEQSGVQLSELSRMESGARDSGMRKTVDLLTLMGQSMSVTLVEIPASGPGGHLPNEWQNVQHEIAQVLPDHLKTSMTDSWFPGEAETGPSIEAALYGRDQLLLSYTDARRPESLLQAACVGGGRARDNELLHLVLHCGFGVGHAIDVITHFQTCTPSGGRLGDLTWLHVVACVRADAELCRRQADYLKRCLDAAKRKQRAQEALRFGSRDPDSAQVEHDQAVADLDGLSRCPEQVGECGERLLVPMLKSTAELLDECADLLEALRNA